MKFLSGFRLQSIQSKIVFWTGLCFFLSSAVIITYSAIELRYHAIEAAKQRAIATATSKANGMNEEIEVAFHTARFLAQTLSTTKDQGNPLILSREQVNIVLKQALEEHPQLAGVYTLWESDKFDGNDKQYVGQEGNDKTGRFAPYWSRNQQGNIALDSLLKQGLEANDERHQCAKQTRLECITDPYFYQIQGQNKMIISAVVPIIVQGEFYGVTGVDMYLDFFQRLVDDVDVYEGTGHLTLITYNGIIVAGTGHPELSGQHMQVLDSDFITNNELKSVQQGEQISQFNENKLETFVPIYFSQAWTPWAVRLSIPEEKITWEATLLMWQMIGIGVILMIGAIFLLWVIAKRISIPIKNITHVAQHIAGGNLHASVPVETHDETGKLAESFNQMIHRLREMIEHDRQTNEMLLQQNAEQKRLLELITTLETPVIPIFEGLLFAPIVGTLDSRRAQALTERLLQDTHHLRARQVVLDITGVVTIDTQVAHALIQMAQALRLLGCRVAITGISPAVAATITQLGVNLDSVASTNTLQEIFEAFLFDRRKNGRDTLKEYHR